MSKQLKQLELYEKKATKLAEFLDKKFSESESFNLSKRDGQEVCKFIRTGARISEKTREIQPNFVKIIKQLEICKKEGVITEEVQNKIDNLEKEIKELKLKNKQLKSTEDIPEEVIGGFDFNVDDVFETLFERHMKK